MNTMNCIWINSKDASKADQDENLHGSLEKISLIWYILIHFYFLYLFFYQRILQFQKINENVGKKGAIKKQTGPTVAIPQPFLAVMESAKSLMDNKEEIPDHLMAQLIKAKLLYTKACEKEKEIQKAVS